MVLDHQGGYNQMGMILDKQILLSDIVIDGLEGDIRKLQDKIGELEDIIENLYDELSEKEDKLDLS